ncbi:MAG: magnesium transporter [Thermodesulfovibrionales bacterium]
MPLFGELFISEILKKPVYDSRGEALGRLKDFVVIRGLPLPVVDALIVRSGKKLCKVSWRQVSVFNKRIIAANLLRDEAQEYVGNERDLFAVRDILDKQIMDANGAKVVRVNDIKLERFYDQAVLTAVDIGLRGIFRRLGIEKRGEELLKVFRMKLSENLISWNYLQPLEPRLKAISLTVPKKMMSDIHPADIAEIISSVSREEGAALFKELDIEAAAETLSELQPDARARIISELEPRMASKIIEQMSPDDAADVLNELPVDKVRSFFEHLEREDAEDIQELLSHEEDTAGGIMTNEFLSYPPDTVISDVLDRFKADAEDVETIYYLFITDDRERLVGVTSLRDLLLADPGKRLSDIMETNLKKVRVEDDEDIVAAAISKYNLVAIPVVNENEELLGIVTVDDILDRILPPKAKRKKRRI